MRQWIKDLKHIVGKLAPLLARTRAGRFRCLVVSLFDLNVIDLQQLLNGKRNTILTPNKSKIIQLTALYKLHTKYILTSLASQQ